MAKKISVVACIEQEGRGWAHGMKGAGKLGTQPAPIVVPDGLWLVAQSTECLQSLPDFSIQVRVVR
ncbi:MAG: hypothetical protein ACC628_06480 [Pirellulaceae bacterium]